MDDPGRNVRRTWGDGDVASTGAHTDAIGPGATIGRYRVSGLAGAGAMGTVYTAWDPELERPVALKMIHPDPRRDPDNSRGHARLVREARALARLADPHVVAVLDVGEWRGRAFVAMELVDGETLRGWLRRERRSPAQIVDVLVAAARGLAAAHTAGVVHCDFKPDNVLVGANGRVCVSDFGLARAAAPATSARATPPPEDEDPELSRTRLGVGTPAYMSPEQWSELPPDAAADQFAFGVTAFEALYGRRPFSARTVAELGLEVLSGSLRKPPRDPAVPRHVRAAVHRMLRVAKGERFADMHEVIAALQAPPSRPLRAAAAAIGGVALIGAAAIVLLGPDDPTACELGSERASATWDERREAVRSAFDRTGLPYAAEAWQRVEPALDAWVERWRVQYAGACTADRQMQCLSDALDDVAARVDVLVTADAAVVQHGSELTVQLPKLETCADDEALEARDPPPPGIAVAARETEAGLAAVKALELAGRYDDALSRVRPLVARADELAWGPLRASAQTRMGSVLTRRGDYVGADETLRAAYWLAVSEDDDALASSIAIELVEVIGHGLAEYDAALEWAEHARAQLGRAPERDPEREADLLDAIGVVHTAAGRWEAARDHHQRALDLREASTPDDAGGIANTLLNLSRALNGLDRAAEAIDAAQGALAVRIDAYGPTHPQVAVAHNTLGNLLFDVDRLDEALAHFEKGLEIRRRALGPDHPHTGTSLNNLGNAYLQRGDAVTAEGYYRQALAIWRESLGPDHPHVANALGNVAIALKRQERFAEALEPANAALAVEEKVHGPDHPACAMTLGNIANILESMGRGEEAIAHHRRALAILEAKLPPGHAVTSSAHANLGIALVEQGQHAEAAAELAEAAASFGDTHPHERAFALAWLARAEHRLGKEARARELLVSARTLAARTDAPPHTLVEIDDAEAEISPRAGR